MAADGGELVADGLHELADAMLAGRQWLDNPKTCRVAERHSHPQKYDVVAHLSARKNEPESVRRLFHKKEVRYAAD